MPPALPANPWLIAGGILSATGALLHLAVIAGGPGWYRFFGAGEGMARMAAQGYARPALFAIGIAALLAVAAAYAFAGAGLIPRLPLMRAALTAISLVYLLRGLGGQALLALRPDLSGAFVLWSSVIVTGFGVAYAVGTWRAWPALSTGG
jgi:hypothetical protein